MTTSPSANPSLAIESLSNHFAGRLDLGVALDANDLVTQGDAVAHHFRRLTAENAMKFGELSPRQGHYTWERADAIANFARRHGMRMTGHTLLWHQMQPAWLFAFEAGTNAAVALGERLRDHIFSVVERYADVVDNWDVVNEAVSDRPNELWRTAAEESPWYKVFGNAEFVSLAFRYAAEAVERYAPQTKLYYNDYEIERADKRARVIEVVRRLRGQGIRIDGVGIQGHVNLAWPSIAEFGAAIDEFAAQELLVKVSELDVSVYTKDVKEQGSFEDSLVAGPEVNAAVAERYFQLMQLFVLHEKQLTSVVFWGLSDDRTWLNYYPIKRPNHPLLFDRAHLPKPALHRLLQV